MTLARLNIANIRNISSATVETDATVNAFYGPNGSGKTSLLEAVYFLGSGRTFRSSSTEPLISRGSEDCTVFGLLRDREGRETRIGVSRQRRGGREINGELETRASELARRLPTLVLGPDTVQLLVGAPRLRRRFLNWGVFHVEPAFARTWEQANRCLRQRNRILREYTDGPREELATWTRELARAATELDRQRDRYFSRYKEVFEMACSRLTGIDDVECRYYRGWDATEELDAVLAGQQDGDVRRGYTQCGHHRADVRIRVAGANAAEVCSRGELKILAWAMVLGQGWLLSRDYERHPVYLVDDVASELDQAHRQAVCEWLTDTGRQVLSTGVDRQMLAESWRSTPLKLFHVERGQVVFEEMINER